MINKNDGEVIREGDNNASGNMTNPGTSGNKQFKHGSGSSHCPVVAQPGRGLPYIPKAEEDTPRGGRNESPRELSHLHEDTSYHVYNYISENEGVEQGARRKHNFKSLSTLDVGLTEKESDRIKLLYTIRDNSYNVDSAARDEGGARSLNPNGQVGENFRRGRASGFDQQMEMLANTFETSSLTTPQQTRHQARGWQSSSPLHPGGRGSFIPNSWREDDQRSLSQGQEKRQEALRQLIQGNMARINAFHHRLNEAMVKQGYNVSEDNIDLELYSQKNLIASTDPSLLASNYEARIKMLNEINDNLHEKLQKKEKHVGTSI